MAACSEARAVGRTKEVADAMSDLAKLRKTDAFATASGLYQGAVVVADFLRSWVRPLIDASAERDEPSAVVFGQFLRVDAWLRTICKLNEPADFQAVAAACRALLETTIDIALIHHQPQEWERLVAWEKSAKHKQAVLLAAYLANANVKPAADQKEAIAFAAREKKSVESLRKKLGWVKKDGSTRHPERWTNRSLSDDAKRADGCGLPFRFEYFYETEYRRLCWLVHGSAFPLRQVAPQHFPAIAALLFPSCGDLGLVASEIVVKHLGQWTGERERDFVEVRNRRTLAAFQTRRAALGLPLTP